MRLAISRGSMTCQRSTQVLRRGSDGPSRARRHGGSLGRGKEADRTGSREERPHRTAESRIVGTRDRGSGQGPGPRGTGRRARGEQEIAAGALPPPHHHSSSGATVSSTCMPKIGDGPLRGWMTISVLTVSSLAGYSELLSLLASSYSASVARFLAPFSARPVL